MARRRRKKSRKIVEETVPAIVLTTEQLDKDTLYIFGGRVHSTDEEFRADQTNFRIYCAGFSLATFRAANVHKNVLMIVDSESGRARHCSPIKVEMTGVNDDLAWVELMFLDDEAPTGKRRKKGRRGKKSRAARRAARLARKAARLARKAAKAKGKKAPKKPADVADAPSPILDD